MGKYFISLKWLAIILGAGGFFIATAIQSLLYHTVFYYDAAGLVIWIAIEMAAIVLGTVYCWLRSGRTHGTWKLWLRRLCAYLLPLAGLMFWSTRGMLNGDYLFVSCMIISLTLCIIDVALCGKRKQSLSAGVLTCMILAAIILVAIIAGSYGG
ncbi:MAG: hypothetical protein VB082_10710 [Christensenella sp.]|nr:hypothetical protein [Christensenella sp.]